MAEIIFAVYFLFSVGFGLGYNASAVGQHQEQAQQVQDHQK